MSVKTLDTEVSDTPNVDPAEGGQVAEGDSGFSEETYEYLDIDSVAGRRVRVKVDGEEIDVPIEEALNGYSRTADYTRKTQEIARQRQELQVAAALQQRLTKDPEGTIKALAQHFGVSMAEARQIAAEPTSPQRAWWDEGEAGDPRDARIAAIEAELQERRRQEAQNQLERTVSNLRAKYADFDTAEVISTALELGTEDLEYVYKALAWDKLQKKQAEAAKLQQQKRQAAVVSGGESSAGKPAPSNDNIKSVRDAWLASLRELGVS